MNVVGGVGGLGCGGVCGMSRGFGSGVGCVRLVGVRALVLTALKAVLSIECCCVFVGVSVRFDGVCVSYVSWVLKWCGICRSACLCFDSVKSMFGSGLVFRASFY